MSQMPAGTDGPVVQLSKFLGLSHHGQSTPTAQSSQGLVSLQYPAPVHAPMVLRQNGGMHSHWQLEEDHRPFSQPSAGRAQGNCCWAVAVAIREMTMRGVMVMRR